MLSLSAKGRLFHGLLALCSCLAALGHLFGQDILQVEPPLIDQRPFDLITLTADEGGASVKVATIPFPNRTVPTNSKPTDRLEVVLIEYPEREYAIAWRSIERIELYERRIYDEAKERMADGDFVAAFQNLSYLLKNYPGLAGLTELRKEFIFNSAIDRFKRGELRQTLSALEELYQTAPEYKPEAVNAALSRVADSLIGAYQEGGNLGSAQKLLGRLKETYGSDLPVVRAWESRLETLALAKKSEAARLLADGQYRQARDAAVEMLSIFPDLKEGRSLIQEINVTHPMVRVGVMQQSGDFDPASLVDWPARRAGALVYRALFQFKETGTEGGLYEFALGKHQLSDDRQQLFLALDPNKQETMNAFGLAQELLERGEPGSARYDPSWAAILQSVATDSANQVTVRLKRPNVLPHALMQWVFPDTGEAPTPLPGKYQLSDTSESELAFSLRDDVEFEGQPVEIIEIFYEDPKEAVNDLLRGEIDVLDQLYPADAKRLAADKRLTIGTYALPTTHMLIPVSEHTYLARSKFRRALLYATNRAAMLTGELLGSENPNDGRLISGPFPIGDSKADPLAYAYDTTIEPTGYSPHLARLLLVMTTQELRENAEKTRTAIPTLEKLVVGCPNFEFARVAVQAMIQQWTNIGIQAEMVILQPGTDPQDLQCDMVYVITTMWEPATDIERLLGGNGIAATDDPFIVQALQRLRAARSWREVRDAMQDLHQLVDFHLPVLPLWQVTDRFASSRYVEGLEDRPVSLYQDVVNWRVNFNSLNPDGR